MAGAWWLHMSRCATRMGGQEVREPMSLGQRAVRGTAIVLASSYANMGMAFVASILLTRLLDPGDFGIIALASFYFSLFDLRNKMGLDFAFVHRQPDSDELIATHLGLQVALSLGSVVITLIALPILGWVGYDPRMIQILIALSLAGLVEAAGATPRMTLEKELIFGRSTVVITGSLFLAHLAAIIMAWQGAGVWSLYVQLAGNMVFSTIGFWKISRLRVRPAFNREIAGWMLRFGLAMSVGAIATTILLQFDYFLVGTFISAATLGYYERAYKIAQWPTGLVTHIVSRTAFPTYAKLQADRPRLSEAFTMTLWLITIVALPIALAIFATAPDFVRLLYGERWLPSAPLLRFLIVYSVLRPLLDDTGALFTATGKPRRISTVLSVQALVLIVAATPLTFQFGAVGTAIGVGIAFIVGITLAYRFLTREIDLSLTRAFRTPALGLLAGLAGWGGISQWAALPDLPLPVRIIVGGGVAAGAYFAVVLLVERSVVFERLHMIWRLLAGQQGKHIP
jgi:lipopolysaccharide exporter